MAGRANRTGPNSADQLPMLTELFHTTTDEERQGYLARSPKPRRTACCSLRISFSNGSRAEALRVSTLSGACVLYVLIWHLMG
jgi:hypothetical protein